MSSVASSTLRVSGVSPRDASDRAGGERRPSPASGWRTVVSGGRPTAPGAGRRSRPRSGRRGRAGPRWRAASKTPNACTSLPAKIAVGGSGRASSAWPWSWPESTRKSPWRISVGSTRHAGGLQRRPVAVDAGPAAQHVGGPADHADPAVAELQQVPGGGQAAVPVGGAHRDDARGGLAVGVDHHERQRTGAELAWTPSDRREATITTPSVRRPASRSSQSRPGPAWCAGRRSPRSPRPRGRPSPRRARSPWPTGTPSR